jgi:regulator of protease activity HflC (stomatin/prohibitin superfamily)
MKLYTIIISSSIATILLISLILFAAPNYKVYSQTLNGKALLQEAEYTRQTRVLEAKAESAELEGQAIITRASAQAEANKTINESLSPEVLQYQFLEILAENGGKGDSTIIYVPTNSETGVPIGLPLPEAMRLQK